MEANRKWSSSRPNDKVGATENISDPGSRTAPLSRVISVWFRQSQFSFCPPGAGSCADGDGGPRPGPAAVSLRGDGEHGEENPLKRSPVMDCLA